MMMKYDWQWPIQASAVSVWRYLRDTERLNKAAGLQVVQFVDMRLPEGGACRLGAFTMLGMRVEWEEKPFEWVVGEWMRVERIYRKGPLHAMTVHFTLEPAGADRCIARVQVSAEPRTWLARPLVHGQLTGLVRPGFARAFEQIEGFLNGRAKFPYPDDPPRLRPDAQEIQAKARAALAAAKIEPELARRVAHDALALPDRDVVRVHPHELAAELGVPRARALRAMLVAAQAGLYDLMWDINCPHCRGGNRTKNLSEVRGLNACLSCNLEFAARFDREVEVTFAVSPRVRTLDLSDHCVGGPGKTPHVLVQRRIAAGQTLELPVPAVPGLYRVRSPLSSTVAELRVEVGGADLVRADLADAGIAIAQAARPGGSLQVRNNTAVEQTLSLDDPSFGLRAVTGAQVSALQAFRSRFVSEVLSPEQQLTVGAMTFMFTDLRSSTAMYEQVGDGQALRFVRRHFDVLFRVVEQNDGAIVKTVGDAVMAVFDDPGDAVRAAVQAVSGVSELRNEGGDPLILRVGLHAGACLAVNLDGRLDYFGSTVNRAARVEHESRGNEIVCTAAVLDDPRARLACEGMETTRFRATLRGVQEPVDLVRLRLAGWQAGPRRSWTGDFGPPDPQPGSQVSGARTAP